MNKSNIFGVVGIGVGAACIGYSAYISRKMNKLCNLLDTSVANIADKTEEEFNDRKKVQKEREEKTKLMADMLFDDKVSAIHSANPNISKQQASCYVVNFCNDYICKENNGGCRGFETCLKIHKKGEIK